MIDPDTQPIRSPDAHPSGGGWSLEAGFALASILVMLVIPFLGYCYRDNEYIRRCTRYMIYLLRIPRNQEQQGSLVGFTLNGVGSHADEVTRARYRGDHLPIIIFVTF